MDDKLSLWEQNIVARLRRATHHNQSVTIRADEVHIPLNALEGRAALRTEVERLRAENDAFKADIEAGRLLRLSAAIGQMVWVPSGDGGIYAACVCSIILRHDEHDAVALATVYVEQARETLEYLIAPENEGIHWFKTEEAARAALGRGMSNG